MDADAEEHAFGTGQLDEQLLFAAEPGLVGLEGRGERGEMSIGILVGFGGGGEAPIPAAEGPVRFESDEETIEHAGELVVQTGDGVVNHRQGEVELVSETPVGRETDDSAHDDPGGTGGLWNEPDEVGDEAGPEREEPGVMIVGCGDLRGEPVGEKLESFVEQGFAGREDGRVTGGIVAEVGRAEGEEWLVTWPGGEERSEVGGGGPEREAVGGRTHAAVPDGARRGGKPHGFRYGSDESRLRTCG
jgi:hypothetical protein